ARMHQAFDLDWLVLFTLTTPDPTPLDDRVREQAQLLRIPDRRDLYPKHGLRLRVADGSLLEPADVVNIPGTGTVVVPDVVVPATLAPGFQKQVTVWAITLTRDGIPSRATNAATAHTGPVPLVVPGLIVTPANGIDTATWSPVAVAAELSL